MHNDDSVARTYDQCVATLVRLPSVMAGIPDPAAVRAAMASVPTAGHELHLARRQVRTWLGQNKLQGDLDELSTMFLALKKVGGNMRVDLSLFKSIVKTTSHTTSVKSQFWLVPRRNVSDIASLAGFVYTPDVLVDAPSGLDWSQLYIVDSCVERSRLGAGVQVA